MSADIACVVATPEGPVFEGQARSVVVPAVDGELGILSRHAPLVGALGYGQLRIENESGKKTKFFVQGGFVQVLENRVTVLATHAEAVEALSREEATRRLQDLLAKPPAAGASISERNEYRDQVAAARARLHMAG
jgi:F-type H+-transporting ATPase subunit epsilon